ncbi:AMP-dependent synthetase/ligase [Timonella senegalensis]|uniref:AMP-dependent synthetase/ligase n=1 Tax=Timonella senegalensis TaxID=1465825 RepID=UPI0002D52AB0|nr:AMP-dependent synthetase/ligase [Timonella senegalensis]
MQEFTSPNLVDVPRTFNINDLLTKRVEESGDKTLFEIQSGLGGNWVPVTAREFQNQVTDLAKGLIASGINAGDTIAIMSRTRYEWTLLDFAIWAVGALPVPVYETSSASQVRWICSDSNAKMIFVENAGHASVVAEARAELPELKEVLVIDDDAITTIHERGANVDSAEVEARSKGVKSDDLATIIYTSGTTGRPKGVELTHWNFVYLTRNGIKDLDAVCGPGKRTLLFMPLAHVFARFIQVVALTGGAVLGHTPDAKNLIPDLQSFKPTFLLAVPRVFEKVYNAAEQKAGSGFKLKMFRWAAKVAIQNSRAWQSDKGASFVLKAQHKAASAILYKKLRDTLGGNAEYAISGGAPLGERLGHFFRGIGVTVLEGYGLTETCAPSAVNRPHLIKIGTVGPPFAGTSIKIDTDGEILLKGDHVFRGYRGNPEATAEALKDGWFHTGDIGTLDDDGYLRITGRKKELIVTAGGKNVAPAVLEDRLRGHPIVSQVVAVGDQRPFIGALVTLDREMLPGWLKSHGLPAMEVSEAATNPSVLAALDRAVNRANQAVSRAESIRKITVLTTDFTEANGYLTPSLKVKRALVLRDFAPVIDDLYGGPLQKEKD